MLPAFHTSNIHEYTYLKKCVLLSNSIIAGLRCYENTGQSGNLCNNLRKAKYFFEPTNFKHNEMNFSDHSMSQFQQITPWFYSKLYIKSDQIKINKSTTIYNFSE